MIDTHTVTLASMFPLMLFAAAYGVGPGMLLGAAYGFLHYMSGGWFVHPVQFLMDYPLAFALIGLTGLYVHLPKAWRSWSLYLCMVLGSCCSRISATVWRRPSTSWSRHRLFSRRPSWAKTCLRCL